MRYLSTSAVAVLITHHHPVTYFLPSCEPRCRLSHDPGLYRTFRPSLPPSLLNVQETLSSPTLRSLHSLPSPFHFERAGFLHYNTLRNLQLPYALVDWAVTKSPTTGGNDNLSNRPDRADRGTQPDPSPGHPLSALQTVDILRAACTRPTRTSTDLGTVLRR